MIKTLSARLLSRCAALLLAGGLAACATPRPDAVPPTASPPGVAAPQAASAAPPPAGSAAEKPAAKSEPARIYKGTGTLLKPPGPDRVASDPSNVTLNFEAADVREIARTILAEILQESYIVDPKVQGAISFRTTRPLPRSALLPTLETVLRLNGIVMVKENGIFKLMPAASARGSLSPKLGGSFVGYTVQVVPLKFIAGREMLKILEPFMPDPNSVKVDELRNLLIIAGTQNELQHMLDTIDMFDVDWLSGMSVGLFTLQSTDVKTVDAELTKIFGDKSLNPLAGVVRLIPMERLNAFIIITPQPHYLEQARIWLERLDRAGSTGAGQRLHVYHVQNGKAENLADLLNQTFGGAAAAPRPPAQPAVAPGLAGTEVRSTTPGAAQQARTAQGAGATLNVASGSGSAEVRVVADKENNALLILATAAGYEAIEAALKRLDTAPRQVLIEVTLAEVTLKDDLAYGIEWLFTNGPRRGGKLDLGTAGLNTIVPGFSYAITSSAGDTIKSVLNLLATDNKLNILSSPHIMVADNQTAKIQVGDSVPTAGPQSIANNGVVVNSVQYLDTGVILSVTPHINAGGLVNLEISQEVSTASTTTTSGLNSPTISKRSAKTVVSVQSGETMVLGGLISENSRVGSSGLPGLSSIPLIGGLFGTQSRDRTRTELVALITPRVANNVAQAKAVSDEFRKRLKEAEELRECGTSNALGYTSRGGPWCLGTAPARDSAEHPGGK